MTQMVQPAAAVRQASNGRHRSDPNSNLRHLRIEAPGQGTLMSPQAPCPPCSRFPAPWYNAAAMSQPAVYLLLFLALVLPVPGAIAVRLLAGRVGERALIGAAAAIFLIAIACALALARAEVTALRVGDLTLFLQATRRSDAIVLAPADGPAPEAPPAPGPPDLPTLTPRPSETPRPTLTATATATGTPEPPTATPEATATATAEPPTATPEPQAGPRRYTVQPGDTFRAIAERFGVSVADLLRANDLTPAQADSLRVGQELAIP